jgi:protein phosphatase
MSTHLIKLPKLCLVVLVGASGAGKSSFARAHFLPTEVVSSDTCRGWVSDNENALDASTDAFEMLHRLVAIRLRRGLLTVVDATNTRPEDRKHYVELARKYHCLAVAIAFDLPIELSLARNRLRQDRQFGEHVVRNQVLAMRRSLRQLEREGFRYLHVLKSAEQVDQVRIERTPLYNDLAHLAGPFDLIGDVHGCAHELDLLLQKLGYQLQADGDAVHPDSRTAVFVGDLVDRGPDSPGVLRRVMAMVRAGHALCVAGNHEVKLVRALRSQLGAAILDGQAPPAPSVDRPIASKQNKAISLSHGLRQSLEQLTAVEPEFLAAAERFMDGLVSHYVLDGGKLIVAHAGLPESMHGRASSVVRSFALYGDTTGETDEFGLPVRYPWALDYRGKAAVVYGHTPVPRAEWLNNTICLDTACVFGGQLTALRYPERTLVHIAAARTYYEPVRPLQPASAHSSAQQLSDVDLDLAEVSGKLLLRTRFQGPITIREDNSCAALETMSRFAVDPKWLIYLPPTMSPTDTHDQGDWLEHPREAFSYYRKLGVQRVVCEEKHMGSRAVVVICKNAEAARQRFGVNAAAPDSTTDMGEIGSIYTRTGRPFFADASWQTALLERSHAAITRANWWQRFDSDWFCLDCELLPWSAKAGELIKQQYAQVGAAGGMRSAALSGWLRHAAAHNPALDLAALPPNWSTQSARIENYVQSYQRYCWPVHSIQDIQLAPFHLLGNPPANPILAKESRTAKVARPLRWAIDL